MAQTYTREQITDQLELLQQRIDQPGNGGGFMGTNKNNLRKQYRYYIYLLRRLGNNDSVAFPDTVINEAKAASGNPSF